MSHIKKYRCLKKVIHQIDKNWTVAPFSKFYGKIWVNFCLNTGNAFFKGFILKPVTDLLKNSTMDFQNSPPFERTLVTITGNFEPFQYFNCETKFLKNSNFFLKTGVLFFSWKNEGWRRNSSIQNCHVISQFIANWMGSVMEQSQRREVCQ